MILLIIFIVIKIITWLTRCVSIWIIVLILALIAFFIWLSAKEKNRYHKIDTDPGLPEVNKIQAARAVKKLHEEEEAEQEEYYKWAAKKKEKDFLKSLEDVVSHLQDNEGVWFTQQEILAIKGLTKNKGAAKKIKELFQFYEDRGCTTTGVNHNIKLMKENCGELKIRYIATYN